MRTYVLLTRRAALRTGTATITTLAVGGLAGAPKSSAAPRTGPSRSSIPVPMVVTAGRTRRSQPHVGLL